MSVSRTPTYRVETRSVSCFEMTQSKGAMEWRTRGRHGVRGYGAPTEQNLQAFLDSMNASMEPGGCNEHLRKHDPMFRYVAARVVRQSNGQVMAEVGQMEQPAFEVV